MQQSGLEWLFRFTQDPKRLWKRYMRDFLKFGFLVWPSILTNLTKRAAKKLPPAPHKGTDSRCTCFEQGDYSTFIIRLPVALDACFVQDVEAVMNTTLQSASCIVLDFSSVSFITPSGLGCLLKIYNRCKEDKKNIYIAGIKRHVRHVLIFNRMFDLLGKRSFPSVMDAVNYEKKHSRSSKNVYDIKENHSRIRISFSGEITASQISGLNVVDFMNLSGEKHIALDLKHVDHIDSSGIIFFLNLQKGLKSRGKSCEFAGLSPNVSQILKVTKVHSLFKPL